MTEENHSTANIPNSVEEAMTSEDSERWMKTMPLETDTLTATGTWELAKLPPGKNAIKTEWVFDKKLSEGKKVDRYKAQSVPRRCFQKPEIDIRHVFATVSRYTAVSFVFAETVRQKWKRILTDIKTLWRVPS